MSYSAADPTRPRHVRKTVTFTGGAGAGAVGAVAMFTCTGRVLVEQRTAFCTSSLIDGGGTATVTIGTAGNPNAFNDGTTSTATIIDTNEWWNMWGNAAISGSTSLQGATSVDATPPPVVVSDAIILTVAGEAITAGEIIFDFWYRPITDDGALVAA